MKRYLLLLKRLFKKKSYIAMLLVVPLMVLFLTSMQDQEAGLLTIGVYIPGTDAASEYLRQDLSENPGSFQFIFYEEEEALLADVQSQALTEGWSVPEDFDETIEEMAQKGSTKYPIQVYIREAGLTHYLAREVLASRVYPLVARSVGMNFIDAQLYGGEATEEELAAAREIYDQYQISGNLFEMGYLDGASTQEDSYLLMPLRGILALWLLLCGIAASMYYLEDERNGLFIWWKGRLWILRDFLYYLVILLLPAGMVLAGLILGGVFTTPGREVTALLLYTAVVIVVSNVLREIVRSIRGIGILTPLLILASAVFSPVFIDLKEARGLQNFLPTFHYLSSIHDQYYVKCLAEYLLISVFTWILVRFIRGGMRKCTVRNVARN